MALDGRPKKFLEDIKLDGWEVLELLVDMYDKDECAKILGIGTSTLVRRIKEEYGLTFEAYKDTCKGNKKVQILKAQFDSAIKGKNVPMQIWLGKVYVGQREVTEQTIKIDGVVFADEDE